MIIYSGITTTVGPTLLCSGRRWARSCGVVAHRRSCRSVEVASGAAESWRWASIRSADAGEPDIPGIFPGSRAYFRAAGHISGQPGSRAYRAAGHIFGQPGIFPDSRAYFRTAGHTGQPGIFPGSRTYFRAAGHISGHSSGQSGILDSRAYFRAAGQPGSRAYRAYRASSEQEFKTFFHTSYVPIFCGRFNVSIRIDNRTPL